MEHIQSILQKRKLPLYYYESRQEKGMKRRIVRLFRKILRKIY